jgi:hypothetical protein
MRNNGFRTMFPSRAELLRMVEWGVVHSNFRMLSCRFTGFPSYLQDYLIIWDVRAILRITKDVDMVFTRRFNICRLQVLVMHPNLIPLVVNVVIGDNLYELKFCVEVNPNGDSPQLMEMDNFQEEGGADQRRGYGDQGSGNRKLLGPNASVNGQNGKSNGMAGTEGTGGKRVLSTYHIEVTVLGGGGLQLGLGDHAAPFSRQAEHMQSRHVEDNQDLVLGGEGRELGLGAPAAPVLRQLEAMQPSHVEISTSYWPIFTTHCVIRPVASLLWRMRTSG